MKNRKSITNKKVKDENKGSGSSASHSMDVDHNDDDNVISAKVEEQKRKQQKVNNHSNKMSGGENENSKRSNNDDEGNDKMTSNTMQKKKKKKTHHGFVLDERSMVNKNLLSLEIESLLQESRQIIQLDQHDHKTKRFHDIINFLSSSLKKISNKSLSLKKDLPKSLAGFVNNWSLNYEQYDIAIPFSAPKTVKVVGSFAIGSMARPGHSIDVAILLPDEIFEKGNDVTNYRYHAKRLLYLIGLSKELKNIKYSENGKNVSLFSDYSMNTFCGDFNKPLLECKISDAIEGLEGYSFRFHPTISDAVFDVKHLSPLKNNVRTQAKKSGVILSSPHYNSTIIEDRHSSSAQSHLAYLNKAKNMCSLPSLFTDTIVLIKIWMRRRALATSIESPDAFNSFLCSMLLAYWLNEKKLHGQMTPAQMFRTFLLLLSNSDFSNKSEIITRLSPLTDQGYSDDIFRKQYEIVVISPCGYVNLAARVSANAYKVLKREAGVTSKLLQSDSQGHTNLNDSIEATLTSNMSYWHRFDQYISVPCPPKPKKDDDENIGLDFANEASWQSYLLKSSVNLVTRSLMDTQRVLWYSINLRYKGLSSSYTWSIDDESDSNGEDFPSLEPVCIIIGLILNPEHAYKLVDKGPDASEAEAAEEFRKFWGDKSELRRFRDGSIVEACVWEVDDAKGGSIDTRRHIPEMVIKYVFQRFKPFNLIADNIKSGCHLIGRSLDYVLQRAIPESAKHDGSLGMSDELACRNALMVFEKVSSLLRSLHDEDVDDSAYETVEAESTFNKRKNKDKVLTIPVPIASVDPACAELRYAAVIPPSPHPLAFGPKDIQKKAQLLESLAKQKNITSLSRIVPTMDAVIKFDDINRWPDAIDAIAQAKASMFIEIANALESRSNGYIKCHVHEAFLDIVTEGYAFRIRIYIEKEARLLSQKIAPHEEAVQAAEEIKQQSGDVTKAKNPYGNLHLTRKHRTSLVRKPLLHTQLHALHTQSGEDGGSVGMASTVRLVKYWIAVHGFWLHISEEAIELIVAYIFINSKPLEPPRSPFTGLIRFLYLISTWDWVNSPLIVDQGKNIDPDLLSEAYKSFSRQRDLEQGPPMFILTLEDRKPETGTWIPCWTKEEYPSASALARMVKVARSSHKLMEKLAEAQSIHSSINASLGKGNDLLEVLWLSIFQCDVKSQNYDELLQMTPSRLLFPFSFGSSSAFSISKSKRMKQRDDNADAEEWGINVYRNMIETTDDEAMIGFNPHMIYMTKLSEDFQNVAEIYCNPITELDFNKKSSPVGVVWKRSAMIQIPFRLKVSSFTSPVRSETSKFTAIVPDKNDMLSTWVHKSNGILHDSA